jgi:hypothetical protein
LPAVQLLSLQQMWLEDLPQKVSAAAAAAVMMYCCHAPV